MVLGQRFLFLVESKINTNQGFLYYSYNKIHVIRWYKVCIFSGHWFYIFSIWFQIYKTLYSIFNIKWTRFNSLVLITLFYISITVCVNNCTNRVDGSYQSCYTCYGYVICSNGLLYNNTCQIYSENKPLLWDNIEGRCEISSYTCEPDYLSSFNWKNIAKIPLSKIVFVYCVFTITKLFFF